MPTAAFIAAAENLSDEHRIWLAAIEIVEPNPFVWRVASEACRTPDGEMWEAGLVEGEPVRERFSMGDGLAPAVTTSITIAERNYAAFGGFSLKAVQGSTDLERARVTLYLWHASTGAAEDVQEMFRGQVFDLDVAPNALRLVLAQDADYDRELPSETIERSEFPAAAAFGIPKPIIIGEFRALNLNEPPFVGPYNAKPFMEDAGDGGGAIPGALVDPGTGGANATVLYAGHKCAKLLDRNNGFSQFVRAGNLLSPILPAGLTENIGDDASTITIADGEMTARVVIAPVDVNPSGGQNTATDPRNAMTLDPLTYAVLNEATGHGKLVLRIGSSPDLGQIVSTDVVLVAIGDATNHAASVIRAYIHRPIAGDSSASATLTGNVTEAATDATTVTGWDTWEAGGVAEQPRDLVVDFTGSGSNRKAHIIFVGLVVTYKPNRRLVSHVDPTTLRQQYQADRAALAHRLRFTPSDPFRGNAAMRRFGDTLIPGSATYETEGDFFGNVKGWPDGDGTYTGNVGDLVERAPDAARLLLQQYGAVASDDFEVGDALGSFEAARDLVRDGRPGSFNVAAYVGEKTSVRELVATLGQNARSLIKRSPKSRRWQFHPLRLGQRPNFRRPLSWRDGDVQNFDAGRTSRADVAHSFRLGYRHDFFRGRPILQAFVGPTSSGQGFANQAVPDQLQVVVAGVNDAWKWRTSAGGPYTDTLTPGQYSSAGLLSLVRDAMRTHVANVHLGLGFYVVDGYNDAADFQVGAGVYGATIPAGYYGPDEFAWVVERTLNAITPATGITWSIVYAHATNNVSISTSGAVTLLPASGPNAARSAWAIAGFISDSASGTTFTAPIARYSRAAWIASTTGTSLTVYGSVAATAAGLLGFSVGLDTVSAGSISELAAPIETGDRVLQAQTSRARYGARREAFVAATMLRNQDAAAAWRNWLFDLSHRPRAWATFDAPRCPDLEVGHVIELDDTIDEVAACPGRTSWANLPLLVVESDYYPFPLWRTRVRVLDISGS